MTREFNIRTAAIIYSEEHDLNDLENIQCKVLESIFVENNNSEIEIDDIDEQLEELTNLKFSDQEIKDIIDSEKFHFSTRLDNEKTHVNLSKERFNKLTELSGELVITKWIVEFVANHSPNELSAEQLESTLTKFVYELLNKNINSFNKILKSGKSVEDINIDADIFTLEERLAINSFLNWDNPKKNESLFALIAYAVEYCLIVNNVKNPAHLIKCVSNKRFYLDTNVIYRAIGLNGTKRKRRVIEFFEKCNSNGQKFFISKFTFLEFRNTLDYHIKQLERVPFRKINPNLFSANIGSGFYQYYHNWRKDRTVYGFDLFRAHLMREYDKIKSQYSLSESFRDSFDNSDKKHSSKVENYIQEISAVKPNSNYESMIIDAKNIYTIELLRGNNNFSIADTKEYLISTDQRLREWDFDRNENQPIVLLPSQWMTLLLKYCSRTKDDFKSFAKFLRLKTEKPVLNEEQLHAALAGISEITEDFETQASIFQSIFETKAQAIISKNPTDIEQIKEEFRTSAKSIADNKIEELKSEIESGKVEKEAELASLKLKFENDRSEENAIRADEFNSQLFEEKLGHFKELQRTKTPIEMQADKKLHQHKALLLAVILGYYGILIFLIFKLGWDIMEQWIAIFGFLGIMVSFLYLLATENTFNLGKYFDSKKSQFLEQKYAQFKFDIERYTQLKSEIEQNDLKK